uniref:Uncharacterized protein n=1 Tax=viral metagenome TaxID=1070528 RepID=A0A6H1ZCG0_9ZZZZ
MKLKIRFFIYGALVFGVVLEQEGIKRGSGTLAGKSIDDEHYSVVSGDHVALSDFGRMLKIRGNEARGDDYCFWHVYHDGAMGLDFAPSEERAKKSVANLADLIKLMGGEVDITDFGRAFYRTNEYKLWPKFK